MLAIRQLAPTSIVALSMRLPSCAERAHMKRRGLSLESLGRASAHRARSPPVSSDRAG